MGQASIDAKARQLERTFACRGLRDGKYCSNNELIDAHVIPKAFARDIRTASKHLLQLSLLKSSKAKAQLGLFDRTILCGDCDRFLGDHFDDYASSVCRRFNAAVQQDETEKFEIDNLDGDRFAKFILSVLWRASISRLPDYGDVRLGPYEDIARDVLFGSKPFDQLIAFDVTVRRYRSKHVPVDLFYSIPKRAVMDGLNGYCLGLAGFQFFAKVDRRPWPLSKTPYVLKGNSVLRGPVVEFERTEEFELMKEAAVNHRIRRAHRSA